jgi:hypothetical protein
MLRFDVEATQLEVQGSPITGGVPRRTRNALWQGGELREEKGVETQPPVHEIADGDVVLWSVDGTVHIKTTNRHNDPVELNEHQALELSDLLTQLVKDG